MTEQQQQESEPEATEDEAETADESEASESDESEEPVESEESDPSEATPEARPGPAKAKPASISEAHLETVLESLIFVSNSPVTVRKLAKLTKASGAEVRAAIESLQAHYEGRGIELVEVSAGFQFRSSPANAPFVRDIVAKRPIRLTRAQLETLSIAAYRQPLTKPELEDIRGVDSSSALKVLLERGVLKILGRKEEPGRPLLYGTTPFFLELFGLKALDELPTLKEFSELSDESKALFARKTGEDIESIGSIEVEKAEYDESEFDEPPEDDEDEPYDEDSDDEDSDGDDDSEDEDSDDEDSDDEDSDGDDDSDDDDSEDEDSEDEDSDDEDPDDDDSDDDESDDDEEIEDDDLDGDGDPDEEE